MWIGVPQGWWLQFATKAPVEAVTPSPQMQLSKAPISSKTPPSTPKLVSAFNRSSIAPAATATRAATEDGCKMFWDIKSPMESPLRHYILTLKAQAPAKPMADHTKFQVIQVVHLPTVMHLLPWSQEDPPPSLLLPEITFLCITREEFWTNAAPASTTECCWLVSSKILHITIGK